MELDKILRSSAASNRLWLRAFVDGKMDPNLTHTLITVVLVIATPIHRWVDTCVWVSSMQSNVTVGKPLACCHAWCIVSNNFWLYRWFGQHQRNWGAPCGNAMTSDVAGAIPNIWLFVSTGLSKFDLSTFVGNHNCYTWKCIDCSSRGNHLNEKPYNHGESCSDCPNGYLCFRSQCIINPDCFKIQPTLQLYDVKDMSVPKCVLA